MLIRTYNEPEDVLLPTIAAAVALEPAHETWVPDDGERPEVEALATELGARYLTRHDNTHAKAGNINHALDRIDADLIAVLDADHVARPEFLVNTLAYFADPEVALVQTPQDFYNEDSFEHSERSSAGIYNEQAVFYRVIAAAKNRWQGAFWCGTCAIVRTEALRSVGGIATGSVTDDILTTIEMHGRGWRTFYHNEVLARGLAARSLDEYLVQRRRWATGAMEVLRIENPLTVEGLSFGQRFSYATTLWAWFDAWRSLGYIVLAWWCCSPAACPSPRRCRSSVPPSYPPLLSILFEFLRMPAVLAGTLALFRRKERRCTATPKGRAIGNRSPNHVPPLVTWLLAGTGLALVWFGLVEAGAVDFEYADVGVAAGAGLFLVANAAMLAAAAVRIRSPRTPPSAAPVPGSPSFSSVTSTANPATCSTCR